MALIKCPECGREISDRAAACPGCGFPVAEIDTRSDMDRIADELYLKYPVERARACKELMQRTGCDLNTAKNTMNLRYKSEAAKAEKAAKKAQLKAERRELNAQMQRNLNTLANLTSKDKTVRCPKCGSTSITYIQKRGGFFGVEVMDGIFAGGSSSKGRCKCLNCGKEWKK